MRTRTLAIILILAAVFVTATLTMGGDGHRRLAKWLPAIHGGR